MATDKLSVDFQKPIFTTGEMPTSGKLNTISDRFEKATDIILRATGNTFLRNISNIAAIMGDASLLSDIGSIVPAEPDALKATNKLLNRIPVQQIGTPSGNTYQLDINPSLYTIDGNRVVYTDQIINIAIAAVLISSGEIYRVYEGTFAPNGTVEDGEDVTSLRFTTGDGEDNFDSDRTNPLYEMVLLVPNQKVINTLMQALVNLGSLDFPSKLGYVADASGTVVTYEDPRSVTDEITFIENKYFYTYMNISFLKSAGVIPSPVDIGTDVTGSASHAWNSATWTCAPSLTLINNWLADDVEIPEVQRTTSTCYCHNATDVAAELTSPNVLRARVYINGGVPLMRADGIQALACFEPVGHGGLPTVYLSDSDVSAVGSTDSITVMVPIAIPFRMLNAEAFAVGNLVNLWPTMILKVIGSNYSVVPVPLPIDSRLRAAEANMVILANAINNLTTQTVTLA